MIELTDRVDPHTKGKLVVCNVCGHVGQRQRLAGIRGVEYGAGKVGNIIEFFVRRNNYSN